MQELPISIRGRFKRSVDLGRDFYENPNLSGYVVTTTARKVLGQLGNTLQRDEGERAWTLTGPYGGGKSAFAVFASHVMRGTHEALEHLREADAELATIFDQRDGVHLCPVLVGGGRKPLNKALLDGLADSLDSFAESHSVPSESGLADLIAEVREASTTDVISGEDAFVLFRRASDEVNQVTGGGLFVVVDELGKLLEYAALNPDKGDIFILQRLAEHASRTTESGAPPLYIITILHQAFERYASHLDRTQREEWQKVQGRFEDVAFVEPADATLHLLSEAIEVERSKVDGYRSIVGAVVEGAKLPGRRDNAEIAELLHGALPLHPLVALLVGPLFRRLAQNERSLFAFLASNEPKGFFDVLQSERADAPDGKLPLYRLDHLYDYLMTTLGATLFNQSTSKLWAETEAALGKLQDPTPLSPVLLKQIALLNYAGDMAGLPANTPLLRAAIDAPEDRVDEELERLVQERVVIRRKYNDTYAVWQGSDIDIEEEVDKARSHVSPDVPLASLLSEVVPPTPIAAHRHSYETGTTRVFEVLYAESNSWKETLSDASSEADGHLLYVLPEERGVQQELIAELRDHASDPMLFFAIPEGTGRLHNAVYELKCLHWVNDNVEELRGDKAARRELRERLVELEQRVDSLLNRLLVANEDGVNPCEWVNRGETFRLGGRRELQNRLSDACDDTFTQTPEIWNELLNVRNPSPSAVRGQKKLLEAMVIGNAEEGRDPAKERLGIDGTPAEYGLYASIVKATGMHREADDGTWHFTHPFEDKKPGCFAVWKRIEQHFEEASGRPVSIDTFFDVLSERPFSVRDGLTPIFLFAYFKANQDAIAIYENGTFLQEIAYGTMERLLKTPAKFELQQVPIEGAREDVLRHLAPLVGLPEEERKTLPVVLRLLRQVHGLPPFVRKTSSMSEEALAVREALHRSTDPTMLLFEDLPRALNIGLDSFLSRANVSEEEIELFVKELQKALREIAGAYDQLIDRIQQSIARAFQVRSNQVEKQRHEIAERAQALEPHVSDTELKAFVIRATNEMMDTQAWYESIAALLAGKPPVKWLDDDIQTFQTEVKRIARKFRNREPLVFEGNGAPESQANKRESMRLHRIRLGITMLGEPEQETIVQVHPEDEEIVDDIAERIYRILESDVSSAGKDRQVKLAALGRLIQRLEQEQEASFDSELNG